MITMSGLQTALLDLLYELHGTDLDRLGMIRLRESRYYRPELLIDEFMSALHELFPE